MISATFRCLFHTVQSGGKTSWTKNGQPITKRYIDIAVVTDERVCDGFYFASALKYMRTLFNNPELLDTPPENIIKDIR